jgi:cytoskeletal protein RodZ
MRKFSVTQIKNKTVGNILKESRAEQNLSLEKAALATRLRPNHLAALEAGDYGKLPGGVYSEKILESYANFLNIDLEGLKKLFKKEISTSQRPEKNTFVQKISSKHFIVTPRLVKISSVIVLILLLLVYLGFEINNIFSPPNLEVTSPIDNLTTDGPTILVTGRTQKEVIVKINDQEIQTDANGNFNESVSLKSGLNVIKISAAKKRSRENIIYRQVILK